MALPVLLLLGWGGGWGVEGARRPGTQPIAQVCHASLSRTSMRHPLGLVDDHGDDDKALGRVAAGGSRKGEARALGAKPADGAKGSRFPPRARRPLGVQAARASLLRRALRACARAIQADGPAFFSGGGSLTRRAREEFKRAIVWERGASSLGVCVCVFSVWKRRDGAMQNTRGCVLRREREREAGRDEQPRSEPAAIAAKEGAQRAQRAASATTSPISRSRHPL